MRVQVAPGKSELRVTVLDNLNAPHRHGAPAGGLSISPVRVQGTAGGRGRLVSMSQGGRAP